MKKYSFTIVILLIVIVFFATSSNGDRPTAHARNNSVQPDWSTAEKVSGDATLAEKPIVTSSPNGDTVLVAYSGKSSGNPNQDPYYSYSNLNGESGSWQKHNIVDSTSNSVSEHIHATFDEQGYAHLIWREGASLAYAKSNSNNNLGSGFTKHLFDDIPATSKILNPIVATYGSFVHIFWVESINNQATNIYHNVSDDHGASWQSYSDKNKLSENFNVYLTDSPAVQLDNDGNFHLVYQQESATLENKIYYINGSVSYNAGADKYEVNKSQAVDITHMFDFTARFHFVDPDITYQNGRIDVSATLYFQNENQNYIYHFYCTSKCDESASWYTSDAISGSALEVNITPSNITSSLVSAGGCPIVIYDGKRPSNEFGNEQLWNVAKCQGWNNWSELTIPQIRAIRPSAEMQENGWWLYAAYEKYIDGTTDEVYFMRVAPETALYLPVIIKN